MNGCTQEQISTRNNVTGLEQAIELPTARSQLTPVAARTLEASHKGVC